MFNVALEPRNSILVDEYLIVLILNMHDIFAKYCKKKKPDQSRRQQPSNTKDLHVDETYISHENVLNEDISVENTHQV